MRNGYSILQTILQAIHPPSEIFHLFGEILLRGTLEAALDHVQDLL